MPFILVILFIIFSQTFCFSQVNSKLNIEKLKYYNEVYQDAIKTKDSTKLAEAYYLFGKYEMGNTNYLKANEWLLKSLAIKEKAGDSHDLARLYIQFSTMELDQAHRKEGLEYLYKALSIFNRIYKKTGKTKGFAAIYYQLGSYYQNESGSKDQQKQFVDSAMYYYEKGLKISYKTSDSLSIAAITSNLGYLSLKKNDKKAIGYLEKAFGFYKNSESESPYIELLVGMADSYIKFGQLEKAIKILNEIDIKIKSGYAGTNSVLSYLEQTKSDYYEKIGDSKSALVHNKLAHEYLLATYQADQKGAVSRLNIEYETEKKEAELEKQKLEIKLKDENLKAKNRFLWIVGSLLFITAILSYVLFKLFKKNEQTSQRNSILLQEQNHRVKNNLQVISSLLSLQSNLLEEGKAKEAVDESQLRIEAMTILHRQLYNKQDALEKIDMEAYIPELTEVIIQSYGQNVETNYDIQQKSLSADKAVLIALVINELVTNACKYAFANNGKSELLVSLLEKGKDVELIVKDNGNKEIEVFSENISSQKNSFGMKLINMMAYELNGIFNYKYEDGSEFSLVFSEI